MAELVDALDSGSSEGNFVEVQVLSTAPSAHQHKQYQYVTGAVNSVKQQKVSTLLSTLTISTQRLPSVVFGITHNLP